MCQNITSPFLYPLLVTTTMSRQVSIDKALKEWYSKNRHMGCVSASNWFCKRVEEFKPKRITRYTKEGHLFEHVICTNGLIVIDIAPYADKSKDQ